MQEFNWTSGIWGQVPLNLSVTSVDHLTVRRVVIKYNFSCGQTSKKQLF